MSYNHKAIICLALASDVSEINHINSSIRYVFPSTKKREEFFNNIGKHFKKDEVEGFHYAGSCACWLQIKKDL